MSKKIDKEKMIVEETRPMGVSHDPMDRVHERRDVNVRSILIGIGAMVGVILVVMAVLVWVFDIMEGRAEKKDAEISPLADTNAFPPAPRLQPSPPTNTTEEQDLTAMRKKEDSILSTYGWVDKPAGVARIPIDSAVAIIGRRGTARTITAHYSDGRIDTADIGGAGRDTATEPAGALLEKGNPRKR